MLTGLKKFFKQLETDAIVVGIVGLIAGAVIILAIRFFTYHTPATHYHANFSVYINGQREQFKSPAYYEEESVASCNADKKLTPQARVHMHNNENDIIHVHDEAVTWGDFFQNLGWNVNDKLIQSPTKMYVASSGRPIHFWLNGQQVINIQTRVIGDRDRLLVDYGSKSKAVLKHEFKKVSSSAKAEDEEKDPASCGGSAPTTTSQKFHHLF